MIELFKFSLLLLYILLVLILIVGIVFSTNTREFLAKVHKSPTDGNSWLRYACSIILLVALGIYIYQATYSTINVPAVTALIAIAIAGKVTASGINKDK